jgi:hypothetical protein
MSEFKIEKGVPIPERRHGKGKYPWASLKIGDSFFVPGLYSSAQMASSIGFQRQKTGREHVCRKEGEGVRVWRTK